MNKLLNTNTDVTPTFGTACCQHLFIFQIHVCWETLPQVRNVMRNTEARKEMFATRI